MSRKAHAIIDLNAIRHNYQLARKARPGGRTVAVVKANAYGHGALAVAHALAHDADAFAVASVEEAVELREGGIHQPILLLEGPFDQADVEAIHAYQLWTVAHHAAQVDALAKLPTATRTQVWLKIDSGMHRLGVPLDQVSALHARLCAMPQVTEVVLMTHFACADEPGHALNARQLEAFTAATRGLEGPRSLANSAALLSLPAALADWQRPGLMLYGASPFETHLPDYPTLQPAMSLCSELIAVREVSAGETVGYGASWTASQPTRVGTVAMGYGDGLHRQARPGTPVLVDGHRCTLIGRVSMDMVTVDLSAAPAAQPGSPIVFWGPGLPIEEVAPCYQSIPYTLTTCLTPRVHRIYKGNSQDTSDSVTPIANS